MPSFDVVSKVDLHELTNAVDQAKRELDKRYDLRGTNARFELEGSLVTQFAASEYQLDQLLDILRLRLAARGIDPRCLDLGAVELDLAGARRAISIKQGIEHTLGRQLVAQLKDAKLKVEAQIQGQAASQRQETRRAAAGRMAVLRKAPFELPLQFENFRDYARRPGKKFRHCRGRETEPPMSSSLRDQLIQAGLVTQKQAQRAMPAAAPAATIPTHAASAPPSSNWPLQRAQAEKLERDQELNRKLQEPKPNARPAARRCGNWSNRASCRPSNMTTTYNFIDGAKIKRLAVTAPVRVHASIRGDLRIVRCDTATRWYRRPAAVPASAGVEPSR